MSSSFFDEISKCEPINRLYYGDVSEKPNDHCFYVDLIDSYILTGWYENDEHLKNRIEGKFDEQR